ncbi:MAG TPA: CHRD domain-containing protein [Planctomycetota bacterium]|nr:CHRD domain-containing protein [Planctomycetota bacterium]
MRALSSIRSLCLTPCAAALLLASLAAGARAQTVTFSASLLGSNQVPPNASTAIGSAVTALNTANNQVSVTVVTSGLVGANAAHLHQAAAGSNGPIILPLAGGPVQWTGSGTLTAAQVADLQAGNVYVNVHTAAFPGGEIRGQLSAVVPSYTLYGAGCGTPVIMQTDSDLVPGMRTRYLLRAQPGQITVLILGLSQIAVPVFGCTLLVPPVTTLAYVTDAAGNASHPLDVPGDPAFVGTEVDNQWALFDAAAPQGIGFSSGGRAVVVNPQLMVGGFSPSGGGIGTVVSLTLAGVNFGNNPDNLCIRAQFPGVPGSSLLRAINVTPLGGGLATVTARLATAAISPVLGGDLMAMRGNGGMPGAPAGVKLSAPAEGWGWNGAALGQAGGGGGQFTAMPNFSQTPIPFTPVGNSLRANLPAGPYTVSQTITLDAHWDVSCPGQPSVHYDHFLGTMTVLANMTAIECRDEVAAKIAAVFNNLFPGKVQVNVPVPGGAQIVITMTDPTCTITGGGGSLYVQ